MRCEYCVKVVGWGFADHLVLSEAALSHALVIQIVKLSIVSSDGGKKFNVLFNESLNA